jgi:hypothetical protein
MLWERPQSIEPITKTAIAKQEEAAPAVDVGELAVQRRGDRRGDQEGRGGPGLQVEAVRSSAIVRVAVAMIV